MEMSEMKRVLRTLGIAAAGAVLFSTALATRAETLKMHAHMMGASEVPPKTSNGMGDVDVSFDTATDVMIYTVTYAGLTGDATAAHFHGPAEPGSNAGVIVPVKGPLASPIKGEATLTPEQAADLLAGKWYFNIHSNANPGGEIRGQVLR
jgi:hypothetical protein